MATNQFNKINIQRKDKEPEKINLLILIISIAFLGLIVFLIYSYFTKKTVIVEKKYALLTNIKGRVEIVDDLNPSLSHVAVENDRVFKGQKIQTSISSSALLKIENQYLCKLRMNENTLLKIEELMNLSENQEFTTISLIKGSALVHFKNVNNIAYFRVNTPQSSLSVKESLFTVIVDDNQNTLTVLKEGKIGVNSIANDQYSAIESSYINLTDQEGNTQSKKDISIIPLFDWNINSPSTNSLDFRKVLESFKSIQKEILVEDYTPQALKIINKFNSDTEELKQKIIKDKVELKEENDKFEKLKKEIDIDIACLETERPRCELKNEKYLTEKNFPNVEGKNKNYIQLMIIELKKYASVEKALLDKTQSETEALQIIIDQRMASQAILNEKIKEINQKGANLELYQNIEKTINESAK